MFTGIVEEKGKVKGFTRKKNLSTLKISARKVIKGIRSGDSVAVNGTCLTVTFVKDNLLAFDMMSETLAMTTLGKLKAGDEVNLEGALKTNGRFHGHFVTGHIDQTALITGKIQKKNHTELKFKLDKTLKRYIVSKGSIAIDGVSLTVSHVSDQEFSVYLIPFTKEITTLEKKKKGDRVNIETDILAKYLLRQNGIKPS